MAFPTVVDADTKSGVVASNANVWALTYPTNLASGDLILAFLGIDGDVAGATSASDPTFPAGWSRWGADSATAVSGLVAAKISNGTETGSFNVTLLAAASESGGWRVFRITGWYGSGLPTDGTVTGGAVNGAGLHVAVTTGVAATPNPANANPSSWDIEDTLWFAAVMADTSRTISVYPQTPSVFTNTAADISGGTGGATLGTCRLTSAAAAVDPGTFTISASDEYVCLTVAVRPSAGATPVTGTGAGTETAQTASGDAAETMSGTGGGSGTASSASGSGTSLQSFTGTGAGTQAVATASGSGLETITGTGAGSQAIGTAQGDGNALLAVTGSGAGASVAATAAGTGEVAALGEITGTGAGSQAAAAAMGDGLLVYAGGGVQVPQSGYGEGTVEEIPVEPPIIPGASIYFPRLAVIRGSGSGVQVRQSAHGTGRVNDDDLVVMAA